jgi:hypothetical protein
MRLLGLLLLVSGVALAQASPAQAPAAQATTAQAGPAPAPALKPIGTVDDLMIGVIWPLSDDLFYVATRDTPGTEEQWRLFQGKMLMLAESANLLMMPGRAWDNNGWAKDAQRLYDAGTAAFKAAKAKDLDKLTGLNDQMYAACVGCHNDYRPDYRKRPLTPPK